jgi:hypothetical protein
LVPDTIFAPDSANLQSSLAASQYVIEVNLEDLCKAGTSSSGIGFASNNFRHGTASQRATRVAFCRRALEEAGSEREQAVAEYQSHTGSHANAADL